jgi:hypothetical protein
LCSSVFWGKIVLIVADMTKAQIFVRDNMSNSGFRFIRVLLLDAKENGFFLLDAKESFFPDARKYLLKS